jgi:hypothetical protein
MKSLTPEQYEALDARDSLGYSPIYVGYKTKKVRVSHYCECGYCNRQYDGWEEIKVPIGKPLRYAWHKPTISDEMQLYFSSRLLEQAKTNLIHTGNST